jgi:hypothetical protein
MALGPPENQKHAGNISARLPIVFNSCGGLGREANRRNMVMGSPDGKAIAVGKTFALTAHQFFSSL